MLALKRLPEHGQDNQAAHEHAQLLAGQSRVSARIPLWAQRASRGSGPGLLWLQPKLTISHPGDVNEQEADRIADHVMRMEEPTVQRCGPGCGCARCQGDSHGHDGEELLRVRSDGSIAGSGADAPPVVKTVLTSPGRPLDVASRRFMEARFGVDFGQVRVHSDAQAAESARAVGARAYTVDRHLAFAEGQYEPNTREGRQLLAHELVHVVQQSNGSRPTSVQRWAIEECTVSQRVYITDAITMAYDDLRSVHGMVSRRPLPTFVANALWLAFRDDSVATADLVGANIAILRDNVIRSRLMCRRSGQGSCDEGTEYGYVTVVGEGRQKRPLDPIYLCMPNFSDLGESERSRALIHEAAHRYLNIDDTGYFTMPECAETTPNRRRQVSPQGPYSGTAGDNPAHRLNNADAYACFVHYLRHVSRGDLETQAADYRGENIKIEPGQRTIYTQTSNPREPTFRARGVPSASGFRFRWRLLAGGHTFRLESPRGYDTWVFEEGSTAAYVPAGVRSILESRQVTEGEIVCEIQVYESAGERFVSPVIEKRVPISIAMGLDPFDLENLFRESTP